MTSLMLTRQLERLSCGESPCRAAGTQRQQRGKKTSLGFKTTKYEDVPRGRRLFTHSDVEYNGNKVSTAGRMKIRGNSTSDFESVRLNHILLAEPTGADF
jgi:hypothetical protein